MIPRSAMCHMRVACTMHLRQALPICCRFCIVVSAFFHDYKTSNSRARATSSRGSEVAWSKVLSFNDPHSYTSAVLTADMQIFPTAKGEFRAELTQVVLNQLRMQRFEENLPRIHKGAIRRDRRVFTFLTADQPEVSNRGRVLSSGEICADDSEVQHVRTEGDYRLGAVSLIPKDFAAACKTIIGCELDVGRSTQFIRPSPNLIERFLKLHAMVGGIAKTTPELFEFRKLLGHLSRY